ncbi:hypothetical protein C0J45_19051 [Silurus meridionalis]|nr:hypothetical protein C0J45_19051 [Silurus meridionalis]
MTARERRSSQGNSAEKNSLRINSQESPCHAPYGGCHGASGNALLPDYPDLSRFSVGSVGGCHTSVLQGMPCSFAHACPAHIELIAIGLPP